MFRIPAQVRIALAAVCLVLAPHAAARAEPGPIEAKFSAEGPWRVERLVSAAPCDRKGQFCDIFYPADPPPDGRGFPAIVWGNGTDSTPSPAGKYDYFLSHLASWGFVVVATRDGRTGVGDTLLDAADYILVAGADPAGPLHGRVDGARMGAVGHSQGASGAANAMLRSGGRIRTAVLLHLPQQAFCNPPEACLRTPDLEAASAGSIFYVSGSKDFIIAPDDQLGGDKLNSQTAYYRATPEALAKLKAIIEGADHNDVTGRPGCPPRTMGCKQGVGDYLGLPTAWLTWRLKGDEAAGEAFREGGEIHHADGWRSVLGNIR